ncbi:MAG: glycosyl transferase family 2 [Bacteroidetes bacterium HGW-Bacteroidetes-4]|jgi:putative flippase GtrA|nr:MAG: glycosyl transferase family 2 [Bacteroidetes bacterium HGW-Bacteroidetes-4]
MFNLVFDKVFLIKFIKFGIVGGSGVVVDFFFTWLFKEKFKVQKYVANALGFSIAASTNWFLNRIWTFNSQNPELLLEYTQFIFVSLIGLGINSLVLWFLTDKLKFNFYLSKLGAIAVTTVWNFFANYLYTFA